MTRIFLLGYMGAGKTTLGKAFAKECGLSFIDLDWYIEERYHKTVSELFKEKGEQGFRELERNILHEVGAIEDAIISTGGGTPCFFDNMEFMNQHGMTIYLDVHPDVLFRRLRVATQARPILQGKKDEELYAFIVEKLNERSCYYSRAQYVFNASKLDNHWQIKESVQTLCEMIGV
ncbi:shikimate kinase [Bacteroides sp. 224]|uniref:shikimate kinase n=1 Tax=Bacteroides sp. 224 TaxID=2302936 RepID=UPI0013D2FDED|nr:shikimate kinase [Bacteroides sp. 224]NDV64299.1 shikimate kinase [Bacteroides sp. 224]